MAAELIEDSIATCTARALVTEFLVAMFGVAALQLPATAPSTYMLGFEVLARLPRS